MLKATTRLQTERKPAHAYKHKQRKQDMSPPTQKLEVIIAYFFPYPVLQYAYISSHVPFGQYTYIICPCPVALEQGMLGRRKRCNCMSLRPRKTFEFRRVFATAYYNKMAGS